RAGAAGAADTSDHLSGAHADADALAVSLLHARARGLAVLRVHEGHVGDVDGTRLLDDAAGLVRPGGRALVALDDVQALDEDALLGGIDLQDAAGLAAILAADHHDLVVGAHAESHQS